MLHALSYIFLLQSSNVSKRLWASINSSYTLEFILMSNNDDGQLTLEFSK